MSSTSVKAFAHLRIPLAEIIQATNNFTYIIAVKENYSRFDDFGKAYKGQLLVRGELITVAAWRFRYGEANFWREITLLSCLKHENIVSNIGYCEEQGEFIIINKHEFNGTLDRHIGDKTNITWIQRLKISVGIARALSYIHYDEGHDLSIIHRDIKSSVIFLDENWVPKLSGFGLAMSISVAERHHAHNSPECGTFGYMDPAYRSTGIVSHKSDVYSLGIVLFEILCGRLVSEYSQGHEFGTMVKYHYENKKLNDLIDPHMLAQMDIQSLDLFSKTAYSCLNEDPSQRQPNIRRMVRVLEKALDLQQKHEKPLILKVPSIVAVEVEDTSYRSSEAGDLEHAKIPLTDILSATENFAKKYEIASGGFGIVYKAKLEHYDRNNIRLTDGKNKSEELQKKCSSVAIKRIIAREDRLGEQGFDAEIKMLINCDHPNIVSLLGFCDDGQDLILVYELASNKSLEHFLENSDDIMNFTLNWKQRLKICIGIACGLNYLHTERGIIHRDVKSANILLNENWDAKIADFGLSTSHPTNLQANTIETKKLAGTPYYMDPEYEKRGILKKASDIYSFGIVLFEIMSGKLAYHQSYIKENSKGIAAIARQCFREETILQKLVDPVLKEEYLSQDSLDTFSKIAYRCLDKSQANRPKAKDIIEELQKALSFQEPEEDKEDILRIPLDNILLATQNFSVSIGSGGFAKVYKGEVTHANEHNTIAAKRLNREYGQGNEFAAELKVLSKCKHENVIGLVGYCKEKDEMVIVYEYASNSSLDRHLSNNDLTWKKRLNICIDVARGIDFLHEGLGTPEIVIHRDIKSSSILLDGDWKAKISKFKLSLTIPVNQHMDYVVDDAVGTLGYVDPLYISTSFLTKESDIYSLGVVLLEVLCGRFSIEYDEGEHQSLLKLAKQHFKNGTLEKIVLDSIKEQIVPGSLATYSSIAFQCLNLERENRPTASEVMVQLTQALEFQVDHEMWEPKLSKDYQDIIQLSMAPESYSTIKKEDLYNIFSNGILLQHEKVLSFRGNGERNEMISARNFSYVHSCPHRWRILPESRFEKVPEMLDMSNLMIEITTRPQFLTPDTLYGVHLVFKFCESSTFSATPTYVNLKYRNGSETLHAYFATWRDNDWMMIELCRFLYRIEDDISFKFLLESLSPCYCRDGAIYVEGIEFRAIDKVKHENIEKLEQVQQLPTNYEEILNGYVNYEDGEKLFWASEVNEKKQLMLSAKAVLYNFSDVKQFKQHGWISGKHPGLWRQRSWVRSSSHARLKGLFYHLSRKGHARFPEVIELLPQQIFHINCRIESRMLSQDTEYVCYLVFKISEESHGLQCPVKVRDLLHPENKEAEFIYFISPSPWNIHDITRVPKQREDGWLEVNVGRFISARDLKSDCALVNLKLTSYEGIMTGLVLCGLEFRPV